jgi:UMF1 family MFS transporter
MSRFVPPHQQAEFFGFFSFSGKATAFVGPFLFGTLTAAFLVVVPFRSERIGISALVLLFLLGGVVLATVNEAEGIRAARLPARNATGPGSVQGQG